MKTFNVGGNGEPLAHGRIWSGPLKLLLPALSVPRSLFAPPKEVQSCSRPLVGTYRRVAEAERWNRRMKDAISTGCPEKTATIVFGHK